MQAAKESEKEGFVLNELEYIYAVARIRALESSLLTQSVIEQLMACQNETQCLQLLSEKGWGDPADEDAAAGRGENLGSDLGYRSGFVCF